MYVCIYCTYIYKCICVKFRGVLRGMDNKVVALSCASNVHKGNSFRKDIYDDEVGKKSDQQERN